MTRGPIYTEQPWQSYAACLGRNTEIFYPQENTGRNTSDNSPLQAHAKAICRTCPVIDECLEYALARPEKFGIWGGVSERGRRSLRSARARAERKRTA